MRRGQVTLFVLAGIVLLILVTLLLVLFRKPDLEVSDPASIAPVRALVTSCVEDSLETLLRRAGANGGFLDTSPLRRTPVAHESDAVEFAPQVVPYWSHLRPCTEDARGCESSEQPPLCRATAAACPLDSFGPDSIQGQVEAALPALVEECLRDFTLLESLYEVQREGPAQAELIFTDEVIATLDMPLTITLLETGEQVTLVEFTGRAPVDLAGLYRLANSVAQAERETAFLEHLTLHLLALYGGVDEPLPPMRSVSLLGQKRYWTRTQVEQLLQEEVLPWSSFIQVPNALKGFVPIAPSEEQAASMTREEQLMYSGVYYYLYVKPGEELYPNVQARFYYPYTKPYLVINGGQEVLKPRSTDVGGFLQKIVGLFMNDYRFRYDLSYPVIVTLTDHDAFGGEGLDFSFALEANIRDNTPVNRSGAAPRFVLADESVDISGPRQLVDNTVLVTATDAWTRRPLPNMRVSYRCGEEYYVGETDGDGVLRTQLPFCRFGGVLVYGRQGYLGTGEEYDNYEERVLRSFTPSLWPLQNTSLTVRKRTLEDLQALTGQTLTYESVRAHRRPLNESDLVLVTLERVGGPYDDDVPLVGFFTFSVDDQEFRSLAGQGEQLESLLAEGILTQDLYDEYVATLRSLNGTVVERQPVVRTLLAPGEYTVEAFLLHNALLTVPEETREFCLVGAGSLCAKKEEMTLPETNFTSWLSGGSSTTFTITPGTLYNNNAFTLHVLEQQLPESWSDLEAYEAPDDWFARFVGLQQPTFDNE